MGREGVKVAIYTKQKKNILKTDEFIREILSNPKIQGQDHS